MAEAPQSVVDSRNGESNLNVGTSVVDYLRSQGQDPSFANRTKLANQLGISGYQGTAQQNIQLLNKLRSGGSSTSTPSSTQEVNTQLNQFQETMFRQENAQTQPETRFGGDIEARLIEEMTKRGHTEATARGAIAGRGVEDLAREYLGIDFSQDGGVSTSVPSFEELKVELTPDFELPDPISRIEERTRLRTEFGVDQLESRLNELKALEEEIIAARRTRSQAEMGKPVSMGVIAGRVGEVERQENERLDFVRRQKQTVIDELNTKYSIIETYIKDFGLDYQDAVDRYQTAFNNNIKVYDLLRGLRSDVRDEERLELAKQDAARTNLQLYTNAIMKGNMDYASLSGDQKLRINKLEIQAGLPIGFVSGLNKDPDADILFTTSNEGITQVGFRNADGTISVRKYGTRISSGSGKLTESERQRQAISDMSRTLQELGGDDYLVSPEEWKAAKARWVSQGYGGDTFDDAFRSIHVDESHYWDYGLGE